MPKKKFALFELSLLMITGVLELVECCGRSGAGTGTGTSRSTGGSGAIWLPDGDCDTHSTQNIVALDGAEVGLAGITAQDDCRDYCLYKPTCWGFDWIPGAIPKCKISNITTVSQTVDHPRATHVTVGPCTHRMAVALISDDKKQIH